MKPIFDAFDRAYAINLKDRTDRRRDTERELRRVGVEGVRFYEVKRPSCAAGFPSVGARGCFESHLAVLDAALMDGLSNVLVCEDDIRFNSASQAVLAELAKSVRTPDWDVIYFGYLNDRMDIPHGSFEFADRLTLGGHFYGVNGPFMAEMSAFMHACAQREPGHPDGGPMCRDGAYNHIRLVRPGVRVFLASPNLATQRRSRTDLHALSFYDRLPILRSASTAARGVLNMLE